MPWNEKIDWSFIRPKKIVHSIPCPCVCFSKLASCHNALCGQLRIYRSNVGFKPLLDAFILQMCYSLDLPDLFSFVLGDAISSLWSSNAIARHKPESTVAQAMIRLLLDGIPPLPELMLIYHQWGSEAFTAEQIHCEYPSCYISSSKLHFYDFCRIYQGPMS